MLTNVWFIAEVRYNIQPTLKLINEWQSKMVSQRFVWNGWTQVSTMLPFKTHFCCVINPSVTDPGVLTETRCKSSISVLTINNAENQRQSSLKLLGPTVTKRKEKKRKEIHALTRDQCQAGISYFNNKAQANTKPPGINLHSIVFNGEFWAQDEKIITADILWLCIAFSI